MNQQPFRPSGRTITQAKYNTARMNLLWVMIFTVVNLVLAAIGSDSYFLFSASIPYYVMVIGSVFYAELGSLAVLIVFVVISVVLTLPYLVCWKFSQKHYGWMIGALVYFVLDCLVMLWMYLPYFDVSLVIDLVFHIWVLYYLIIGVKYGAQMAKQPEPAPAAATAADYDGAPAPENVPENTVPLRMAGSDEKIKVYAQAQTMGHTVVYRKYGKNTEELVVDGHVYAEFVFKGIAKPHVMNAVVDGMQISAGYYQQNYIMVNGDVVAQSVRWI